jgi:hypothetical protein
MKIKRKTQKKSAQPATPTGVVDALRVEVERVFRTGGLEGIVMFFVAKLTSLAASRDQLHEALRLAKVGRARSGSERGPHGPLDPDRDRKRHVARWGIAYDGRPV